VTARGGRTQPPATAPDPGGQAPTSAINRPEVVAEVQAAFDAYEHALVRNDRERLDAWFWADELTVRYGVAERLYGADAIAAWRRTYAGVPPGRRLGSTVIATFGRDAACVSTEFTGEDTNVIGRQSQTWMRLDGHWQIVAAHVSHEDTGTS